MVSNPQAGQVAANDSQASLQRWLILGLLSMGMMIAYFDRVNLSVVLALKDFKQLFLLTDQDRGVLNSAFFISYALLQIPVGWFVDRYGVKYPYAAGFLLWSLFSAGTGMARSVRQLFFFRVALGVSESIVTPAGMRWIRFNYPERQRGLAVGIYMAAAKVGPALGAPLAAWLVQMTGWRSMFYIMGLGCLIWLVPWQKMVKDDRREAAHAHAQATGQAAFRFTKVLASPVIWGTVIGTFSYSYFLYFCMTWMPAYFVERRNLSLDSMGLYTMFSFLGMAVVATLAGWAADRIIAHGGDPVRVRKAFTIAGFLVASTEVIGAFSHSSSVALFFAIFSLSGLGLTTANYWALTQTLIPGTAVGRIVGIQNFASNVPGIVAPLLTGWLKQVTGSYEAPMAAIVVFLVMGITAYVFLVRQEYAPKEAAAEP
jgi:MFS family permease